MVYLEYGLELGRYQVGPTLGEGRVGAVFSASRRGDPPELASAAVKWPTNEREVSTLQALHRGRVPCLGVPAVHDSGTYEGKPWVAIDLLGPSLFEAMGHTMAHNWRFPAPQRWLNIRIVGRLLLRRLKAIHERGFVHCDIQPDNVLLGRRGAGSSEAEQWKPFFVDFGLAHPWPGGAAVQGHAGTIEYNSIRSTDGGVRLPRDDVEALGWVLCYFVVGDLPWFSWVKSTDWGDKPLRTEVCRRVQRAKLQLVGLGAESFEKALPDTPAELAEYLRLCRRFGDDRSEWQAAQPDYEALARLLGGAGLGGDAAELQELAALRWLCCGGAPSPEAAERRTEPRHFLVGTWSNWSFEEMAGGKSGRGLFRLELQLPRDGGEFQVVRDGDWKQVYHPERKQAGRECSEALGPDAQGHGLNWYLEGRAGDVYAIEFDADARHLSWKRLRQQDFPRERLSVAPSRCYSAVGTWDDWSRPRELAWDGSFLSLQVCLGSEGKESFQILENGDWKRKLHPSVKGASPHVPHTLLGPEEHGHGKNWTVGAHPRDRGAPGARFEVRLQLVDGAPCRVLWARLG